MAETGVFMDVEAVEGVADGFNTAADALKVASQALEAAIITLRITAFVGLVGGLAVERFLSNIKPHVDRLGQKCEELNHDLIGAIVSYRDGDTSGSKRFQ